MTVNLPALGVHVFVLCIPIRNHLPLLAIEIFVILIHEADNDTVLRVEIPAHGTRLPLPSGRHQRVASGYAERLSECGPISPETSFAAAAFLSRAACS
jgi:hypothetical protein